MADITMCEGKGCKAKNTCLRYTAKAGFRQSYFIETPIKNNGCDHYINHNYAKR